MVSTLLLHQWKYGKEAITDYATPQVIDVAAAPGDYYAVGIADQETQRILGGMLIKTPCSSDAPEFPLHLAVGFAAAEHLAFLAPGIQRGAYRFEPVLRVEAAAGDVVGDRELLDLILKMHLEQNRSDSL